MKERNNTVRTGTLPLLLAVTASLMLGSCATEEVVVSRQNVTKPYETSVDKMFALRTGMSLAQVTSTLGCQPHQFYFDGSSGCKVFEFRYRRKYHEMGSPSNVHYRDEGILYTLFYDDKLREIITSSGQKMSIPLMIDEVNIRAACSYGNASGNVEAIRQRYGR